LELTSVASTPTRDGEADSVGAVELEPEIKDALREVTVNLPPVGETVKIRRVNSDATPS
jgi:hypothetical protein